MSRTNKRTRSRSSTGCLTCRRRKKKCDESSYPVCQNCVQKLVECKWSNKAHTLHKQLAYVRYLGGINNNTARPSSQSEPKLVINDDIRLLDIPYPLNGPDQPHNTNSQNTTTKLTTDPIEPTTIDTDDAYIDQFVDFDKYSFLQKIAMQQDIVDD